MALVLRLLTIAGLLLAGHPAFAQDYPERPISMIVPFPPGGAADIVARIVTAKVGDELGQTVIIINRPGAGTILGAQITAGAKPDGYTLLLATSSTQAINATLYKKLPFDPASDLVPVALVDSIPFVLVTDPKIPVKTVADLIKLAKEKKGEINFASGGMGSAHHLFMELFDHMTGIQMTHIPYRGTAPALNDLLAGRIPVMFTDIAAGLPFIKGGKLHALGVSTKERSEAAPDIPTLAEAGVPGFDAAAWHMVVAPKNTPHAAIDKLNKAFNKAVNAPEVRSRLVSLGLNPLGKSSPTELTTFLKSETARWGEVVRQAGVAGSQ